MSCCNCDVPLSLRAVEPVLQDGPIKSQLIAHERAFSKKDVRTLYFTTLSMIVNTLVLLFVIAGFEETSATRRLITVECIFMICYALGNSLIRIWNIKFYMLQPILTIWQNFAGVVADKLMFFWSIFFVFLGVLLMIGVIIALSNDRFVLSIILTCVDCVIFIMCTLFYRLHVGIYIAKIISSGGNHV